MYDKLLKILEKRLSECTSHWDLKEATNITDLIIKIKTIQALDTSADLIRASRQVGRN